MNKLIDVLIGNSATCIILQTDEEHHYYWWEVPTEKIIDYDGSLDMFINDPDNGTIGCSCASFNSPTDALKDYLI